MGRWTPNERTLRVLDGFDVDVGLPYFDLRSDGSFSAYRFPSGRVSSQIYKVTEWNELTGDGQWRLREHDNHLTLRLDFDDKPTLPFMAFVLFKYGDEVRFNAHYTDPDLGVAVEWKHEIAGGPSNKRMQLAD